MRNLIVVIAVLVLVGRGIASETVCLTPVQTTENGMRTVLATTRDVLDKSPDWSLEKEPPLSIHDAIAAANGWAKNKYPQLTNLTLRSISLSRFPVSWDRQPTAWPPKPKDKWYYMLSMQAAVELDGINAGANFQVIVLMDGTVVGPSSLQSDEDVCSPPRRVGPPPIRLPSR